MPESPCAVAILDLLTLFPDCEMRASDVWAELDAKWPQPQVDETLEALVRARLVTQLQDAGHVWYSAAVAILPAAALQE